MGEKLRTTEEGPEREGGQVEFRDITMQDCEDMVNVINSLVEEKAPIARQTPITLEQNMESLALMVDGQEKGNGIYKVAEKDSHVVGWAELSAIREEQGKKVGTLGAIMLEKSARGTGVADKLLETTIKEAQEKFNVKEILLYVFGFNKRAIKFYEKHGFEATDEKVPSRDYYGKKRRRIEMLKILE